MGEGGGGATELEGGGRRRRGGGWRCWAAGGSKATEVKSALTFCYVPSAMRLISPTMSYQIELLGIGSPVVDLLARVDDDFVHALEGR